MTRPRRRLVVGNWKMYRTPSQAEALARAICDPVARTVGDRADVVAAIAPPFTALPAVAPIVRLHPPVALCAQNVHWEDEGAFTGEISAPMLLECDVRYVIVGHSERRRYFGETDATVAARTAAALRHGLTPIVAVGETLDERERGETETRVLAQVRAALDGIAAEMLARVVVAYEPVWAIGTGRNCDPAEAGRIARLIRSALPDLDAVSILYGGSVKPDNFPAYLAGGDVDGGLVGGASLDADAFAVMVRQALAEDAR